MVEAAVPPVAVPVPADDQRRDAGGVRRRHRGALQVGVVAAARRPCAVLEDRVRSGRHDVAVRVDQALLLQHLQRVRRQDLVAVGPVRSVPKPSRNQPPGADTEICSVP